MLRQLSAGCLNSRNSSGVEGMKLHVMRRHCRYLVTVGRRPGSATVNIILQVILINYSKYIFNYRNFVNFKASLFCNCVSRSCPRISTHYNAPFKCTSCQCCSCFLCFWSWNLLENILRYTHRDIDNKKLEALI